MHGMHCGEGIIAFLDAIEFKSPLHATDGMVMV